MVKIGETKRLTPKVGSLVELKVEGHANGVTIAHEFGGLNTGLYVKVSEIRRLKIELDEYLENTK